MTDTRETTRGIVLATIVVFSVFALAFVGGAGAASTDDVDSLASQAAPDNVTADTILGDVNENDNIGLSDAILIQEEVVGIRDPGTTFDADAADLNRDGSISLTDAILVQEKAVGILNEGEITVSNLDAPDTAQSGSEIDVSADLENLGDEGALQDIEFRIAPVGEPLDENATVATEFVDMAASGVSSPVDRPAQTCPRRPCRRTPWRWSRSRRVVRPPARDEPRHPGVHPRHRGSRGPPKRLSPNRSGRCRARRGSTP